MRYFLMAFMLMFSAASYGGWYEESCSVDDCSAYKKHVLTEKQFLAIKGGIEDELKDPESLRFHTKDFRQIWAVSNGKFIVGCTVYNAKNSYGGYGEPGLATFTVDIKGNSGSAYLTKVSSFDIFPSCNQSKQEWSR